MRILFFGDSVTEADRNKEDPFDLGPGYARTAADLLRERFPEVPFEFFNRGISGNRAIDLYNRLQKDCLDLHPDVVVLLVGVNDSMHRTNDVYHYSSNGSFRQYYESLLKILKEHGIRIVMMEPFCLTNPNLNYFRFDLLPKIDIVRELALVYADRFVVLDGPLWADAMENGIRHLTDDGVHPNVEGRKWLGGKAADAIAPLIGN